MHSSHNPKHQPQHHVPPRACRHHMARCMPLRGQCPQQACRTQIPRGQPEADAFGDRVGRDIVQHADVGQHVREVQKRHAQKAAGEDEHISLRVEAVGFPAHRKNQCRHHNRERFEALVERQKMRHPPGTRLRKIGPGDRRDSRKGPQHRRHRSKTGGMLGMDLPPGKGHVGLASKHPAPAWHKAVTHSCISGCHSRSCRMHSPPTQEMRKARNKKTAAALRLQRLMTGGVDGTRTRDPRRDRPVF